MSHDNPMLKVPVWTTEDAAVAIDWELEHGADDDVTRLVTVPFVARQWVAGKLPLYKALGQVSFAVAHLGASGILSERQIATLLKKGSVKIRPNTHVALSDREDAWLVLFWSTYIIKAVVTSETVTFTLNSGGHMSHTTKDRFNEVLHRFGIGVFQRQYHWYVTGDRLHPQEREFVDGMTIEVPRQAATSQRNPRRNASLSRMEQNLERVKEIEQLVTEENFASAAELLLDTAVDVQALLESMILPAMNDTVHVLIRLRDIVEFLPKEFLRGVDLATFDVFNEASPVWQELIERWKKTAANWTVSYDYDSGGYEFEPLELSRKAALLRLTEDEAHLSALQDDCGPGFNDYFPCRAFDGDLLIVWPGGRYHHDPPSTFTVQRDDNLEDDVFEQIEVGEVYDTERECWQCDGTGELPVEYRRDDNTPIDCVRCEGVGYVISLGGGYAVYRRVS